MDKKLSVGQQSLLGYLPATIIKNILEQKFTISDNKLPQHYVTKSVAMFADISGFTKLSEGFSKKGRIGPEFLTFCLNRYMEQLINAIGKNGGDIFKFAGDAIMVIWPPEDKPDFLVTASRRAIQCALEIQSKLNNQEISSGKTLSVKIGIGVGECRILVVGGQFHRCEYLCVGEAMKQACESETKATGGGQTIMSEYVKALVEGYFVVEEAKGGEDHGHGGESNDMKFFLIHRPTGNDRLSTKAEAYLMRTRFSLDKVRENQSTLRSCVPKAITDYLDIEKESWSKEIRMVTVMFLNLRIDLSQIHNDEAFQRIQYIVRACQRSIYLTKGALNKFLMDDKGSVMLICWGVPPLSSAEDHVKSVCSALTLISELKKYNCPAVAGITTGTCFSGVCGTIGNRREYSLLGEVVNLSARYMGMGKEYSKKNHLDDIILIDEKTKDLIQHKIRCEYVFTEKLKGFTNDFHFYQPVSDLAFYPHKYDPFPWIRTHYLNAIPRKLTPIPKETNIELKKIEQAKTDPKNFLRKSLVMVGRKRELQQFVAILNHITSNRDKKIILVKGLCGSGKSLFIRKGLYEFLEQNQELKNCYFNKFPTEPSKLLPNFILTSFQTPISLNNPFNGFTRILREMYLTLTKNLEEFRKIVYKKYEKVQCDQIGSLIIESSAVIGIKYIEEILNAGTIESRNIDLSIHFDKASYTAFLKSEIKFPPQNRDSFFTSLKIDDYDLLKSINDFFIGLTKMYREHLNKVFPFTLVPLIFVIEDSHCIDEFSIQLIREFRDTDYPEIYPISIIITYQAPFSHILKNPADHMSKAYDFIDDNEFVDIEEDNNNNNIASFIMDSIVDFKEVQDLIKNYFYENIFAEYFTELERVDKEMIKIVLRKSFGGIPLFILDVVDNLIQSKKYVQILSGELVITSELLDMEEISDWCEFKIPFRMEKIIGELIDSLSAKEIIILKYASVIGNLFDIEKLNQLNPFNNISFGDLYEVLINFEQKGIIEILYNLHPKHKQVVCKFSFPFIREILYQRMLIEQRNEIHLSAARSLQVTKFKYLPHKIEVKLLEHHLKTSERSIVRQIEEDDKSTILENGMIHINNKKDELNLNNLKIFLVTDICEKLKAISLKLDEEQDEGEMLFRDEKITNNCKNEVTHQLKNAIKMGFIEKKSDGKITWEYRYFIMTHEKISYYYQKREFLENKLPLASFYLTNMYDVEILNDYTVGGKQNLFSVQVSSWYKKDQLKGPRKYFFSCKSREELYNWVITLNFLRVKATYDEFASQFGMIKLPLRSDKDSSEKKKLKRQFKSLQKKPMIGSYYTNMDVRKSYMSIESIKSRNMLSSSNSRITLKRNSVMTFESKSIEEEKRDENNINISKKTLKYVIGSTMVLLLGYLQEKVFHGEVYDESERISTPQHLNKFVTSLIEDYNSAKNSNEMEKEMINANPESPFARSGCDNKEMFSSPGLKPRSGKKVGTLEDIKSESMKNIQLQKIEEDENEENEKIEKKNEVNDKLEKSEGSEKITKEENEKKNEEYEKNEKKAETIYGNLNSKRSSNKNFLEEHANDNANENENDNDNDNDDNGDNDFLEIKHSSKHSNTISANTPKIGIGRSEIIDSKRITFCENDILQTIKKINSKEEKESIGSKPKVISSLMKTDINHIEPAVAVAVPQPLAVNDQKRPLLRFDSLNSGVDLAEYIRKHQNYQVPANDIQKEEKNKPSLFITSGLQNIFSFEDDNNSNPFHTKNKQKPPHHERNNSSPTHNPVKVIIDNEEEFFTLQTNPQKEEKANNILNDDQEHNIRLNINSLESIKIPKDTEQHDSIKKDLIISHTDTLQEDKSPKNQMSMQVEYDKDSKGVNLNLHGSTEALEYSPVLAKLKAFDLKIEGDEDEFLAYSQTLKASKEPEEQGKVYSKTMATPFSVDNARKRILKNEELIGKYDDPKYEYVSKDTPDEVYQIHFSTLFKKFKK